MLAITVRFHPYSEIHRDLFYDHLFLAPQEKASIVAPLGAQGQEMKVLTAFSENSPDQVEREVSHCQEKYAAADDLTLLLL